MAKCGIYAIKNILDGRTYIGSSKDIEKRWNGHRRGLDGNKHHNLFLQRAWNKSGAEAFDFSIVEECASGLTKEQLFAIEQRHIDSNVGGYNLAPAGGGDIISNHPNKVAIVKAISNSLHERLAEMTAEERKAKFGKSGALNPNWRNGGLGKTKVCPICNVRNILLAKTACYRCRDRTGTNNPFNGKTHTQETKDVISEYQKKNSTIRGIDPALLSYTKHYQVSYPDGRTVVVIGLKAIAKEFNTTIANVSLTVERMASGKVPLPRSRFYQHMITVIQ